MLPTTLLADPALRTARTRVRRPARPRPARRLRTGWILLAALALAAAGVGVGYLRVWPPLATVMSASMAPTIDTGDMVVLKRLDRPARKGDVVSIRVPDEARRRFGYPPVVIHRIVAITPDGTVTTKGDAYEKPDPFTVPSTALTTSVVTHIPAGGQVLAFLGSPFGLFWLLSGGVLLFGMPLLDRYRSTQRRGNDLQEQLAAMTAALEQLPAQIEQAVATAVATIEPPAPSRFVPASQFTPAPTPDLMSVFARPAAHLIAPLAPATPPPARVKPRWDALPAGLINERRSGGLLCA
jgi:signal peptidase I